RARDLHSFPTRRSSDLVLSVRTVLTVITASTIPRHPSRWHNLARTAIVQRRVADTAAHRQRPVGSVGMQGLTLQSESPPDPHHRSEEHTSELQSREKLV